MTRRSTVREPLTNPCEKNLLLYYITDRMQFPGHEAARRERLLEKIADAARCGMDYVQLREKDLSARELEALAASALQVIREDTQPASGKPRTRLLINSRTDIALAIGGDGVHLRSDDISPGEARKLWEECGAGTPAREPAVIAKSCHSVFEVAAAATAGAGFAVFAPVFEKNRSPSTAGLESLHEACKQSIPVLALGGITLANAHACVKAGAAGIAAIRLFQGNEIAEVVRQLRGQTVET
jgi:thiamine-phosphate pyrophosphorylase